MSRALVARAPVRIDLGGGWTDVPPYPERDGGAVCNVAIARYATARVSVGAHESISPDPLVQAALRRAALPGARAALVSDFPVGSGLGGSSAAGVALAGALAELAGLPLDCSGLAERSRATEADDLGIAGGCQDHYAAAHGGALLLTVSDCVGVELLPLSERFLREFPRRALLVYTGESRMSAATITVVRDAYAAGDARVTRALHAMRALAVQMAAAVRAGDLDALGALVGEHWTHQRALHPAISTGRIDAIERAARGAGALGMKALGASGGGCIVAFAAEGRDDELASALAPLGERLAYAVDTTGFSVLAAMDEHHAAEDADA